MDDLDIEHIDRMGDNALNVVVVIPMVLDTDLVQDEHGAKLTEDEAVDLLREHLQQNVPGLTGDLAAVGPVSVGPGVGDGVFIPPAHLQAIWNDMRSLYAAYTQSVANPPAVQAMGAALSWMAWPYSELLGIPMADVQKCLEAGQSEPPLLRPLASST